MTNQDGLVKDAHCLNCQTPVSDRFCPKCGQDTRSTTITIADSLANTFSEITNYDGRIFVTLREMFINPGRASLAYVMGQRVRFIHPVKYFIITMGISLVIIQLLQAEGTVPEAKINLPEFINLPDQTKTELAAWLFQYAQFIMLAFLPMYGFFLRLVYANKRTAGEATVLLFYLNGNLALLTALIMLAGVPPNPILDSIQSLFFLGYSLWAVLVFFEATFWNGIWRAIVAYGAYALSIVVVMLSFIKAYELFFT